MGGGQQWTVLLYAGVSGEGARERLMSERG